MRSKLKALMIAPRYRGYSYWGAVPQAQVYYTINGQPAAPAMTLMMAQKGLAPGAYWSTLGPATGVGWVAYILWATIQTAERGGNKQMRPYPRCLKELLRYYTRKHLGGWFIINNKRRHAHHTIFQATLVATLPENPSNRWYRGDGGALVRIMSADFGPDDVLGLAGCLAI
jgi:hypothetical protein